jgi:ribosomal protein L35AE/L33A
MKKIKLLLGALTIIILLTSSFEDFCRAAEVTRINQPKGQIFINEGKDAGFIFGAKVCFHSSSDKELICGKVLRTTGSYAIVRIKNVRKTKHIEIGSEAILYVEKKSEE